MIELITSPLAHAQKGKKYTNKDSRDNSEDASQHFMCKLHSSMKKRRDASSPPMHRLHVSLSLSNYTHNYSDLFHKG